MSTTRRHLIRPWTWQLLSPSFQVHCTFTYVSCKQFGERSHANLSSEPSFSRGSIIVTDFLPKLPTIFWLNCPVWSVLLPDWSSICLATSRVWRHPSSASLARHLESWVHFKLGVLARRCIHGSALSYLSRYCIPVNSIAGRSHLRSDTSGDLFIL